MTKTASIINPGDIFGRLTVINSKASLMPHTGEWLVSVRCSCGTEKTVRKTSLLHGHTTSCGCYKREYQSSHGRYGELKYSVNPGERYGRLTVLEITRKQFKNQSSKVVTAKCDCGKVITTTLMNVAKGFSTSCGCLAVENSRKAQDARRVKVTPGQVFGKWTVVKPDAGKRGHTRMSEVTCSCGTVRLVATGSLARGEARSCGAAGCVVVPPQIPGIPEREALEKVLREFPARDASIVIMRLGLDGSEPRRLREVAEAFGISRERVRQIQQRALAMAGEVG